MAVDSIKKEVHEDFGEKIGGAKKDLFVSKKDGFAKEFYEAISTNLGYLNEMEQKEYVSVSNIFKPINVEEMREKGVEDPASVRYMQAIRSGIATKPTIRERDENMREYLVVYINFVKHVENVVMEASEKYSSFSDVEKFIDDNIKSYLFTPLENSDYKVKLTRDGKLLKHIKAFNDTFFDRIYNKFREKIDFKNTTWDMLLTKRGGFQGEKKESVKKRLKSLEHLEHVRRDGIVRRLNEEPITTDEIHNCFSFKGGEFGNWLSQKERGEVLNMAYEAFYDMADVMGATEKDISLNSSLSIAFGSRGSGKANAHYEPMRRVINLTRKSGAGSLAHEWFHALDNWIGSFVMIEDKEKSGILTYDNFPSANFATCQMEKEEYEDHPDRAEDIEKILKLKEMFRELGTKLKYKETDPDTLRTQLARLDLRKKKMRYSKKSYMKNHHAKEIEAIEASLGKTNFFKDAERLDEGKPYYSLTEEMGARAFESYVLDELQNEGYRNDYLVATTKKSIKLSIEDEKGEDHLASPYPQGDEREMFRKEFRKIMDVLFPDGERMAFKKDVHEFIHHGEDEKVERENEQKESQTTKVNVQNMRQLRLF